ncbi:MAG: hypothetical protein ABR499_17985, partial [Gemmatimonadaceae bacterium]
IQSLLPGMLPECCRTPEFSCERRQTEVAQEGDQLGGRGLRRGGETAVAPPRRYRVRGHVW